jgi:uncharacterized membrane protein AbrB (regulator of aidB expression)
MTIRTGSAVLIKLLGLYYGASALLGVCASLAYLVIPGPSGVLKPAQFALGASIGGWVGAAFVASLFVLRGDDIAKALFSDSPVASPDLPARALLAVGICLVGVCIAASGLARLARAAATALWYAGGGRQAQFADAMRGLSPFPVDTALSVIVGSLVAWHSTRLSVLLYKRDPESSGS